MSIEIGEPFTIWANPQPLLLSRQAAFAGIVPLGGGELLAMFSIGQAFDAADLRAHVCRSTDSGRSWSAPVPMHEGLPPGVLESESFKPLRLTGGELIATGYVFERPDMLTPIVDPDSLAVLPLVNKVSFSGDNGASWTVPRAFSVEDAPLELSGPPIETASGRLLAAAAPFHLGETGHEGWIVASDDGGESWFRLSTFFATPGGHVSAWECRIAELAPARIAVLFWAYDNRAQKNLCNRIALSDDDGRSFRVIDMGVCGQASNLLALGEDRLLTIHAHREAPVGLVLRDLQLSGAGVEILSEAPIFGETLAASATGDIAAQFGSLSFGQPSLTRLNDTEVLAAWWQVESCQHVIKGAHIRLGSGVKA